MFAVFDRLRAGHSSIVQGGISHLCTEKKQCVLFYLSSRACSAIFNRPIDSGDSNAESNLNHQRFTVIQATKLYSFCFSSLLNPNPVEVGCIMTSQMTVSVNMFDLSMLTDLFKHLNQKSINQAAASGITTNLHEKT